VIAYGGGGALDTVIEGESGVFFREQTPEALADTVRAFDANQIDPSACRANAERFAKDVFKESINQFIEERWG
jgi:glycosyltransferase involved in cell wall biosynthesis